MKIKTWTRNSYHVRGLMKHSDKIHEALIGGNCIICGQRKIRKTYPNGNLETMRTFLKRKTCGRFWNGEQWEAGDCYKISMTEEKNPNYKGIMPKCVDCGKKISYPTRNKTIKRCHKCYDKWARKSGFYDEKTKVVVKYMKENYTGKVPESLIPFQWEKGHITNVKKGEHYEEVFGKNKSDKIKKKISKTRIERIQSGEIKLRFKDRVLFICPVCNKELYLLPYQIKNKKVCSHKCAGIIGNNKKYEMV